MAEPVKDADALEVENTALRKQIASLTKEVADLSARLDVANTWRLEMGRILNDAFRVQPSEEPSDAERAYAEALQQIRGLYVVYTKRKGITT